MPVVSSNPIFSTPKLKKQKLPDAQTQYGYTGGSFRYPVGDTGTVADYRGPSIGIGPTTYRNPAGVVSAQPPGGYGATTPVLGGAGPGDVGQNDFNPRDWALQEYKNDPRYGDYAKMRDAALTASRGALANQLRSAVIGGGWGTTPDPQSGLGLNLAADPTLAGFAGDIDAGTLASAASNPMSTRQQLLNKLNSAQTDIPWQLGARGAAESGAAGALSQGNLESYKGSSYNAIQDLLQGLYGNAQSYGQTTREAESGFNTNINDLINSLALTTGQHTATSPTGYNLPAAAQPTVAPTQKVSVTQTQSTPNPKTATNVKKVLAAKAAAKKISTVGYGGGGWNYPGGPY